MTTRLLMLALGIMCAPAYCEQDDRPIVKDPGTRLVPIMDATARADFAAACIRVTRDVKQQRLTVFAVRRPMLKLALSKKAATILKWFTRR